MHTRLNLIHTINRNNKNKLKMECKFYFLFAVIANQYTKPGAKPTMSGIHTGHASAALVI